MFPEVITRFPDQPVHKTPLLFVHGACLDARWWDDFFLPYFARQGYASHALSLRGHESDKGWFVFNSARIRNYVEDVEHIMASLPQPPILIGHSMGGCAVLKVLERHHLPAAILLASVPPHGIWQAAWRTLKLHAPGVLRDILTLKRNPFYATPQQLRVHCFSAELTEEQLLEYHARLHMESIPALLDMLLFDPPRPREISTPLLVLGAENDALFSPGEIKKTARSWNAQYEIFPMMAHNMMQEAGWQRVADRILGWLEPVTLDPGG